MVMSLCPTFWAALYVWRYVFVVVHCMPEKKKHVVLLNSNTMPGSEFHFYRLIRQRAPTYTECTVIHVRYRLGQGSQTRGPRAACGPRNYFVRPAAMSTNLKILWIKTTCIIHFTRKNIIRLRPLLTYIYRAFPLTRE